MSKLRIGFVGAGTQGQAAHLKQFATLPDCEVVALAELRPELARQVAARWGIPQVYADHAAMLANEELDAIVASQPFARHAVLVPELLEAGVPVMIEKPLAASVPGGEQVLRAVEGSGTWIMVGYHKRSDPATIWARGEIERLQAGGELGSLRYVRVLMPAGDYIAGGFFDLIGSEETLPPLETEPPPPDLEEALYREYTVFVNYYIHQVNLLRHLLGEPYRVVFADPSQVLLVAESESGVTATLEMSPYHTSLEWEESALVCFERGYVKLELPAPLALNRAGRVELYQDPGEGATPLRTSPTLPWVGAMRQQAMNFLAAVRGEAAPTCDAAEALEDLRVAREYLRLLRGV